MMKNKHHKRLIFQSNSPVATDFGESGYVDEFIGTPIEAGV